MIVRYTSHLRDHTSPPDEHRTVQKSHSAAGGGPYEAVRIELDERQVNSLGNNTIIQTKCFILPRLRARHTKLICNVASGRQMT